MAAEYMPQTGQLLEAASANIDLHSYRFVLSPCALINGAETDTE
jgi:hypothetical protein